MSQYLFPLFGEYDTDQAIARASSHRGGIILKPGTDLASTGTGDSRTWTIDLMPNADHGFWAWKTPWVKETGAFTIAEDAPIRIIANLPEPAAGLSQRVLLVGRWKWIAGVVGGDGKPTGEFTANQHASYETLLGTAAASPTDPAVATLDAAGRPAVVLARVTMVHGGTPIVEFPAGTMLDLVEMALKLDGMHRRIGDELHTGRFQVSHDPDQDLDVLRKKDQVLGSIKPYASAVYFGAVVPDAWGNPPQNLNILPANRFMASGSDIEFEADGLRVKMKTAGYYLINGETYSQKNTDMHDLYIQIFQRPAGTTGASDVKIHDNGMSNIQGGIHSPIIQMVSANAGDWVYFKGIGKRSYWIDLVMQFMGIQQATAPLQINTPDWTGMEANGQVYPKIITIPNSAMNNTGTLTWSIEGGTAAGFTTMNSVGTMTLNLPSTGSWTLQLKVVDGAGGIATKTINITLNPYTVIPLVISTGDLGFVATTYPYAIDVALTSSGGQPPITYAVLAGAFTTLPGATVVGGHLQASVSAHGTWTVRLQATDSAGTPQVVTKDITVTVQDDPGGGGGGCFEEDEVYVLHASGTGVLLKDTNPGSMVKAVLLDGHRRGLRQIRDVMVTDKTRVPATPTDPKGILIEGVKCTTRHPWGIPKDFSPAEDLRPGDTILTAGELNAEDHTISQAQQAPDQVRVRSTIGTTAGTYFVGPTAEGPWFMVHNMKPVDPEMP